MPPKLLQQIVSSVAAVANTTVNTPTILIARSGWLTLVWPNLIGSSTPPHGRYYGSVELNRVGTFESTANYARVWAGYICRSAVASCPQVYVEAGDVIYLNVSCGTNVQPGDVLNFQAEVHEEPTGGSFIFSEVPGAGPGERFALKGSNPGAGADFVYQPPLFVIDLFHAFICSLTSDGTAGNRFMSIVQAGEQLLLEAAGIGPAQTLSLTYKYKAIRGFPLTDAAADNQMIVRLATPLWPALKTYSDAAGTHNYNIRTRMLGSSGFDAGDTITAIAMDIEEWAYPAGV